MRAACPQGFHSEDQKLVLSPSDFTTIIRIWKKRNHDVNLYKDMISDVDKELVVLWYWQFPNLKFIV